MSPDTTPTYIAYCPLCSGLLAAYVADATSPSIGDAVKNRRAWVSAGYRVETQTVQTVRGFAGPLGHRDGCAKARRRRPKAEQLQLSE